MKFFRRLFGSEWEESSPALVPQRPQPHYDTLAEQVMANRNEVIALHGEIQRLSSDLVQSLVLNRALIKLLVEQGVASSDVLQSILAQTLDHVYPAVEAGVAPSRFCEDCGRAFVFWGQRCAYCLEPVIVAGLEVREQAEPRVEEVESGRESLAGEHGLEPEVQPEDEPLPETAEASKKPSKGKKGKKSR